MSTETPVVPMPTVDAVAVAEPAVKATEEVVAVVEAQNRQAGQQTLRQVEDERTWSEEIEMAGSQLVEQVKQWLAEGNGRRLILRTPDNSLHLEIPLVAGAVVGGVVTFFAPLLAVVGAIASVLARVKVEIVRVESPPVESSSVEVAGIEPPQT